MPILVSDGGKVDSCRIGDVALDAVYLGDDKMWPLFTAQGMTKVGTQAIASILFSKITGWTPDAGSSVVNDALLIPEAGDCTISAAVAWVGVPNNPRCRVVRNGTVVATSASGSSEVSVSMTVAAGDLLTLEASTTSSQLNARTIAASGTFLRLIPA